MQYTFFTNLQGQSENISAGSGLTEQPNIVKADNQKINEKN